MSDGVCGCSCDSDNGEHCEVGSSEVRTARKSHECCECHGPINRGEKYEYFKGLFDGMWTNFKTCIPCTNVRSGMCGGRFVFEELWSTIRECLRERDDPDSVNHMLPACYLEWKERQLQRRRRAS
jgi:hypothetical protein